MGNSCSTIPIIENTRVPVVAFVLRVKLPSASVLVAFCVPLTAT